jgi:enamine deaminase RidA (YjgF/YER057c/UK114 family)
MIPSPRCLASVTSLRQLERVTRRLISSGNPLESSVGYSRAVVQGDWCFVAGTTGRDPETGAIPAEVAEQTRIAFRIIADALAEGGFTLADIVRATYYVVDVANADIVSGLLGQYLGDIRPAATLVIVAGLVSPDMKIEIEVTAFKG